MPETPVDIEFEERWAAWQVRGAAQGRATRRKWVIVAAVLILAAAVVKTLWFW